MKRLLIIALTGLLLFAFSGPLPAMTVWESGRVTKSPWVETHRHIEVNGVKYTFMPQEIKMERLYRLSSGQWQVEDVSFRDIRVGDKIWMRIQGHRIYEVSLEGY
jgi:hypothetical protein